MQSTIVQSTIACHGVQRVAPRIAHGARTLQKVQKSFAQVKPSKLVCRADAAKDAASTTAAKPVVKTTDPMNLVFVSTEVAPWSKTGGLGDVVGSLPVELAKRGHNVISIAPRYDQYWDAWDTDVVINVDGQDVRFFHSIKNGVHRVWVDHPWFLAKVWGMTGSKLYGPKAGADFVDNQKRFALFSKAAIEALRALPFGPGEDATVVANDWHAALVPVLLKDVYQPRGEFLNTKVALCIHNIAFQGRFWEDSFKELGLPATSLPRFQFTDGYPKVFDETSPADEFGEELPPPGARYAKINWLQAGISAADKVLTVSPHYAAEISSGAQLGVELDKAIGAKGVEGIVNGMDVAEWSPARDKFLAFKYNADTVEAGKAYAKAQLQREAGLPVDPKVPVFGFIGRLEEQKGVDVLIEALKKLPKNTAYQIVVLGTGKKTLEAAVKNLDREYPGVAAGVVK